jgi:hypothetical protein
MPLNFNGVSIKNIIANNNTETPITKVIINGVTRWELVTATFDGLVGATPSSYPNQVVVANEDQVVSPGSPSKTGHTFTGWSPALPTTISQDTTFTAQFLIQQFTVTFVSNGGSAVNSITQNYNTSVAEPTAPVRSGYTFGGWYYDSGLTNPVS